MEASGTTESIFREVQEREREIHKWQQEMSMKLANKEKELSISKNVISQMREQAKIEGDQTAGLQQALKDATLENEGLKSADAQQKRLLTVLEAQIKRLKEESQLHGEGLNMMEAVSKKCEDEIGAVTSQFKTLELTHGEEVNKREAIIREKENQLKEKAKEADENELKLKNEILKMSGDIAGLTSEVDELKTEKSALSDDLLQKSQDIKRLLDEAESQASKAAKSSKLINDLNEKVELLRTQVSQQSAEIGELAEAKALSESSFQILDNKFGEAVDALAATEGKLKESEDERRDVEAKLKRSEGTCQELAAEVQSLTGEKDTLIQSNAALGEENKILRDAIRSNEVKIADLGNEIAQMKEGHEAQLAGKADEEQTLRASFQAKMDELAQKHEDEVRRLEEQKARLEDACEKTSEILRELEKKAGHDDETHRARLDALNADLQKVAANNSALEQKLIEAGKTIASLEEANKQIEAAHAEDKAKLNGVESELSRLKMNADIARADKNEQVLNSTKLEVALKASREEAEKLRREIEDDYQPKCDSLKESLVAAEIEVRKLQTEAEEIETLKPKFNELEAKITSLECQNDGLKGELDEAKTKITELEKKKTELLKLITEADIKNHKLESEKANLMKDLRPKSQQAPLLRSGTSAKVPTAAKGISLNEVPLPQPSSDEDDDDLFASPFGKDEKKMPSFKSWRRTPQNLKKDSSPLKTYGGKAGSASSLPSAPKAGISPKTAAPKSASPMATKASTLREQEARKRRILMEPMKGNRFGGDDSD